MPGDQEVKVQVIKMKLKSESLYHKEDKIAKDPINL